MEEDLLVGVESVDDETNQVSNLHRQGKNL